VSTLVISGGASVDRVAARAPGRAGSDALLEIGRLSAHLAAFERVVIPAAERTLPDGRERAAELRRRCRGLAMCLHRLDRHLTGDTHLARASTRRLHASARAMAEEQAEVEREIVDRLGEALDDDRVAELGRAYHRATVTSPTRPHPNLPRRGLLARVAVNAAARVDRVRDLLDNRPVDRHVRVAAERAIAGLDAPATAAYAG
jgi:hypothetical protein